MTAQVFELSLTRQDQAANPYFYVPFEVPAGTTRIDVALKVDRSAACQIDLGLLEPQATSFPSPDGIRGWSGGARDDFFVATDDATPGYHYGPIPAGTWQVILGLYRVPEAGAKVTVRITLDAALGRSGRNRRGLWRCAEGPGGTRATYIATPSTPMRPARPKRCTRRPARRDSIFSPSPITTPPRSVAISTRHHRPSWFSSGRWRSRPMVAMPMLSASTA